MKITKKFIALGTSALVVMVVVVSSVLFLLPMHTTEAARNSQANETWLVATESTRYLAPGDLYRVTGDTLEVLIIEDGHNTMVSYPVKNTNWQTSSENTKYLAVGDIYRIVNNDLQVLIVEDNHETMVTYSIE